MQEQAPQSNQFIQALNPKNGRWETATIVDNPDNKLVPLVQFPDGAKYPSNAVQRATTNTDNSPNVAVASPVSAPEPAPLTREERIKNFRFLLLSLDRISQELFQLPADVVIQMIHRYAVNEELSGSGQMRVFAGQSQFVPDQKTFEVWFDAYVTEVEGRRLAAEGGAEV